jgi:hypothetical protein
VPPHHDLPAVVGAATAGAVILTRRAGRRGVPSAKPAILSRLFVACILSLLSASGLPGEQAMFVRARGVAKRLLGA